MGLFRKNPNETAYTGGKKHWADVIKNTGLGGDLIWHQPEEDFNTNSTLIVNPGEEAVFIKGGQIEQVFQNGTYKLSTENYPFISRLRNAFTGGISTFNCHVYFVRTATSIEIKWGTDSPIQVRDKFLNVQTNVVGRGAYKVKVANAGLFLTNMIGGNIHSFAPEDLQLYFRNEFLQEVKGFIAEEVNKFTHNEEILGIQSRQREFARAIEPELAKILAEYGIELLKFTIASLDIQDDNLRRQYDQMHMDARAKMVNAQADLNVMQTLGQNWGAQQQVDIMKKMAENSGAASIGSGIGMGLATGSAMFGMTQQMMQQQTTYSTPPPPAWFNCIFI